MKNRLIIPIFLLLFQVLLTANVYSQHGYTDAHHAETTGHNESHAHRNHIALMLGGTSNFDHELTGFTIGLDYEFRFKAIHDLFGLGLFGEYIAFESGEIITGIPVFLHPLKGLKITASPILVFAVEHDPHDSHDNHGSHDTNASEEMKAHFGGRLGLSYNFHLGNLSIGPLVNLDYSNTVALNYGLNIGFDF